MGIDSMRVGGGRCPSLIVGGLLLACFLLVCNWWSLSSENLELLRQIDDLSEQLKISAEERDQCVTQHGHLEQRYKNTEHDLNLLHVQLEQEKDGAKRNEESLTMCRSELDSLNKLDASKTATLETLRLEKDTINVQLEDRKEENRKLQEELDNTRAELNKIKLSAPEYKKPASNVVNTLMTQRTAPLNNSQLPPVPESVVRISPSGRRGMKYHDIPILPQDSPNATRQHPRVSVTMLKAATNLLPDNETLKGGNQESQGREDEAAAAAAIGDPEDNVIPSSNDDVEGNGQDGERDQAMNTNDNDGEPKN